MNRKDWFYCRVSSKSQSLLRQVERAKELGFDERSIITEKKSGKDFESREAYQALRNQMMRSGDTLTVISLDRLGRNKAQIKEELEYYKKNDIRVKILDIPTTLTDFPKGQEWVGEMVNNILIEVLGSMAETERDRIKERQAMGIAAAKKKGTVKFGRPQAEKPKNWDNIYTKWKNKEISAVEAMKETGLTKTTFYKFANEG